MSHSARLAAHDAVSAALASRSDRAIRDLLDTAMPIGSGIGGTSARLDVAGCPVFVKRIPVTDPELRSEHVRSTANLFDLPAFCHYGVGAVGSPGFGAWRELAVHVMTTDWVLASEYAGFPLMHHWRVLPGATPLSDELADVDRVVSYWGGGRQIRHRIEALEQASSSIVIFSELIPQNLHDWLSARAEAGEDALDRACRWVEPELRSGVSFMNSQGLLHFDAHFENVLTDGRRLYFADYGLALSSTFALSPGEIDFLDHHWDYDRAYTATYLVNWLVTALHEYRPDDRDGRYALVRRYADGEQPTGVPTEVAATIARHAPVAATVSDFNRSFQQGSRLAPYPATEVRRLHSGHGRRRP